MKYCRRCLYSANHPLNLTFDTDGVCSGCRVHEEKDYLNWGRRGEILKGILDKYRGKSRSNPDCVIPVSGARDSYFIVHTMTKVYGMNPLLVSYNRHFNTERGIRNLTYLRTNFDCDFMQMVISPETVKRITRETVRRMASIYWHVLAGQTVWPVQVAVRLKIPLIIWGAHQGLDQVGMFSHTDEVEMTRKYRREHDLMGYEAEDLIVGSEDLKEHELRPYFYPNDRELSMVGVRGIYLGNYIRWDSKRQHEEMIRMYEYEAAPQLRTFDTYNDIDCHYYSGLHDWIKFMKWGYGKVTDHATREIRLRRMTREEGVDLVCRYQNIKPHNKLEFLKWIEMEEREFDACIDKFRDPRIWRRTEMGEWELRDSVLSHANDDGIERVRLQRVEPTCEFIVTLSKDPSADERRRVLVGRGYVEAHPATNRRKAKPPVRVARPQGTSVTSEGPG